MLPLRSASLATMTFEPILNRSLLAGGGGGARESEVECNPTGWR